MIGAKVVITDKLAIAAGRLAAEHPNSNVTISYDDDRPQQCWDIVIEQQDKEGISLHSYVVNDETGETMIEIHSVPKPASYLRDLGRRMDEATRSDQ